MKKTLTKIFGLLATIGFNMTNIQAETYSLLELERSSDLQTWQSVPVTSRMINASGRIELQLQGASEYYRLKISTTPAPSGLALIPAGVFTMGDTTGDTNDVPVHTVSLDAFYIAKYEVTKALWDEVRTWAISNGYSDLAAGEGKAPNHPVHSISWYEMVKWCNARSQKEGLTPAYYTDDAQTTIYKTGEIDLSNTKVKWNTNSYRLPTEAEWEKAARGGLSDKGYPWGDTISQSQANYYARNYTYDLSGSLNSYHPSYAAGGTPYTSPVGDFAANNYGVYDMIGNIYESCWDWYGNYTAESQNNPHGVSSGSWRVIRGGSWENDAYNARVFMRSYYPSRYLNSIGFRVARSLTP